MEIGLTEASEVTYFTNVVKLLGVINDDMTLNVTPEGMSVTSMDPSHVAMIDLKLKKSAFGKYEVEEPFRLSFTISELRKRLEAIEAKKELVTIRHDVTNAKLVLDINEPTSLRRREMKIKLLEPYEEEVPKPKILFHGNTRILLDDLDRGIKDALMVSEHMKIRAKFGEKTLAFEAEGDLGESLLEIRDPLDYKNDSDGELSATYTIQYLANYVNAIKPFSEVVRVEMNTDMPVKITLDGSQDLECDFYLAPCIGV